MLENAIRFLMLIVSACSYGLMIVAVGLSLRRGDILDALGSIALSCFFLAGVYVYSRPINGKEPTNG